jgi:hypothetical protein
VKPVRRAKAPRSIPTASRHLARACKYVQSEVRARTSARQRASDLAQPSSARPRSRSSGGARVGFEQRGGSIRRRGGRYLRRGDASPSRSRRRFIARAEASEERWRRRRPYRSPAHPCAPAGTHEARPIEPHQHAPVRLRGDAPLPGARVAGDHGDASARVPLLDVSRMARRAGSGGRDVERVGPAIEAGWILGDARPIRREELPLGRLAGLAETGQHAHVAQEQLANRGQPDARPHDTVERPIRVVERGGHRDRRLGRSDVVLRACLTGARASRTSSTRRDSRRPHGRVGRRHDPPDASETSKAAKSPPRRAPPGAAPASVSGFPASAASAGHGRQSRAQTLGDQEVDVLGDEGRPAGRFSPRPRPRYGRRRG